ncbi:Bug family tripartite tricarboxylate transporter substrate binding protein [Azohydromonas aeria]|uniref:Bug family tripartite tricarboxylate transporter substrate binding protein n=1 Tax=Azohydromonas aeria TaxID=2590212 RepID=UPI001E50EF78|nr:tripartite tricarboxylate transporter substrate binding protein [Azohydromonas aeria]
MRRQFLWSALAAAALGAIAPAALAQPGWPSKPIRVVLSFPPGGPTDIVMRVAAEKMQADFRQPIVIENKPGAGGNLAAAEVARAAADGHTWLWSTDTVFSVNPHVYPRLGFKPQDLVPVTLASAFSQTLVCNPAAGVRTLPELLKKARATRLSYASGGNGVPGHLAMELLLASTGVDMDHVPYKGPALAVQDVIGGVLPCGFLAGPTVLPHVRSGRLLALAVSGARRSPVLPEVPTVAEAGVAGFDATFFTGLSAPRGTPDEVQQRFRDSLARALKDPAVVEKLKLTDQEVVSSTPAQARLTLEQVSTKWGAVARKIGLQQD